MAKALTQFSIVRAGDAYTLTIEDEDGETTELTCDFDQLDVMSEAIDAALDSDEEEMLQPDDDDGDTPNEREGEEE